MALEYSECQDFHRALNELRMNSIFCDVTIVDDYHQKVSAHAAILAAASDVLKSTLTLQQTSQLLKQQGVTLKISGITVQVWEMILEFIYLRQFSAVSLGGYAIKDFYRAAKMLGIQQLVNGLEVVISSTQIDVDLTEETDSVRITLAPTTRTETRDQGVQVEGHCLSNPETMTEHTYSQSVQSTTPVDQTNSNSETAEDCVNEILNSTGVNQEATAVVRSRVGVRNNTFSCRFCKLHFDSKSSLVNHLNMFCKRMKRSKPEPLTNKSGGKTVISENITSDIKSKDELRLEISNIDETVQEVIPQIPYFTDLIKAKIVESAMDVDSTINVDSAMDVTDEPIVEAKNKQEVCEAATTTTHVTKSREREKLECLNVNCKRPFSSYNDLLEHHRGCIMADTSFNVLDFVDDKETGISYAGYVDGFCGVVSSEGCVQEPMADLVEERKQGKPLYRCCNCKLKGTREKMVLHMAVVHGKRKPFHCKECDARYGYYGTFVDHYAGTHGVAVFTCSVCAQQFRKREALRRHVLVTHKRQGKHIHKCKGCGKMFKYASHARRHETYHKPLEQRRTFKCPVCDKAFLSKQDLFRHKEIHVADKKFKCSKCAYTAIRRFNVVMHERKHGIVHGNYVCITCGRYFLTEFPFNQHLSTLKHEGTTVQYLNINELSDTNSNENIKWTLENGESVLVDSVLEKSDSALVEHIESNENVSSALIENLNMFVQNQVAPEQAVYRIQWHCK